MPDPDDHYILREPRHRHNAMAVINELPTGEDPPYMVVITRYRRDRSLAQNRLYWFWLHKIAKHIEDTGAAYVEDEDGNRVENSTIRADDLHDWYREAFLPERIVRVRGRIKRSRKSTTRLTVGEFTEYLNRVEHHAWNQLGLILPHPEDYAEAMGHAA